MNSKLGSTLHSRKYRLIIFGMLLMTMVRVQAAGFYLTEVGSPHSVGTAGVANPTNIDGADSSWSNPAGMSFLKQDQIFSGLQVIVPNMKFKSSIADAGGHNGGNAGILTAVPSFFYVNRLSDQLSFGFSVAGTMGGGVDYGEQFAGRYSTINAQLGAVGMSPSVAYKINDRFSVGAGVSIIYTVFEQEIGINPALVPTINGSDGRLDIENANDLGYQPFFSLNYRLTDDLLLGVVYRAEMDVELTGGIDIHNVRLPLGANKIKVDWKNPQWLEVGLSYKVTDKDTVYVNGGWQDWSEFSQNTLAFSGGVLNPVAKLDRNFKDTWHAGLAYSHITGEGSAFSLGTSYDSSPVNDRDRTFDLPFDELIKLSAAYAWKGKKNFDFAIGSTLYLIGDAPITQASQGVNVGGEFDKNSVLFFSGTMRYVF